ncbi:MAG: response regulator, partial [Coriobacteriales bacterium]|nr:response regulator [Coriobacteriales bacterium]
PALARAGAGGGGAGGGVGEADAGGAGGGAGDTDEAARGDDTGDTGDTGGADGADEATKTGNEQKYDVYFIDWNMPDMDGIELTRRVKARFDSEALVIMTSSVEWDEIKTEATDAGVDRFLQKPLSLSSIADCLNELFAASAIRQTEREAEQLPDLGSYRILLAEDMEVNREIVLALLEPTGLIIECAENGLEALQKYESDPARYALIFMDVQMPEMDGYEATQKIRALDTPKAKKVPIVAMTANVFREDVERCLNAGMNDHVGKPLDFPEVIAKLKKWLPAPLPSPSAPMEK